MARNSNETTDEGGFGMPCLSCASTYQAEIDAEMIIHFSGLKNLDKPGVRAFPKIVVCLVCGFSRFTMPESELPFLANAAPPRESATPERCH